MKNILLWTNGSGTSLPALTYGVRLANSLHAAITLVGIIELDKQKNAVQLALETTKTSLEALDVPFVTHVATGTPVDTIPRFVTPDTYLVVFGPLGRPKWKRALGFRSLPRMMSAIQAPLLFAPTSPPQISNILLCMGGLGYANRAETLALQIALSVSASITIFHVVEPGSFHYPTAEIIQNNWEHILDTDTPQGRTLRDAVKKARETNLPTSFKVRHGEILHELKTEIQENHYDLIAMGSAASAHGLRHNFRPNISAQLSEAIHLPILIAPAV